MLIDKKLKELGYPLPKVAGSSFSFVPVVVHNGIAYISGQLPMENGEVKMTGKLGENVSVEQAKELAELCILRGLSYLSKEIGSLDRVERIVKLTGFVSSAEGFNEQPVVIDAASQLLEEVFGDNGKHARSAIGVAELPRSSPVEIEMIVAIK